MSFVSGIRHIMASLDIFMANLINYFFNLIGMLADINLIEKLGDEIFNRVYTFIGIFVLFKAALIVIRYVISPDEMVDKAKGGKKFLVNVLVSLALLTSAPALFEQIFKVQAIVLNENIIGKIIFGESYESDLSSFGKDSTYYLFSSFIDYDRKSDFKDIFENCTNIFRNEDKEYSTGTFNNYCCSGDSCQYTYYKCATYLTKGANVNMDLSGDDKLQDSYFNSNYSDYDYRNNIVLGEYNVDGSKKTFDRYDGEFLIIPSSSNDNYKNVRNVNGKQISLGYHSCSEHMVNAGYCGVENGIYLYWLIQKGRLNRDVSLILSREIVTAEDSSFLLYKMKSQRGETSIDDASVNEDDPNGGKCDCDATGSTRDADTCNKSAGGFIFKFDLFLPFILSIIFLIIMFFLCLDVGIRSVKLAFLRIMSPIAFVSYMDVKESNLFKQWLKTFLNTFLDLFIKLAAIYLACLIVDILKSDSFDLSALGDDTFVKIIFMIGCFFFAKELPDFISKFLNLGGDSGTLSYMKRSVKYMLGLGKKTIAVASAGALGTVGGLATGTIGAVDTFKNNNEKIKSAKADKNVAQVNLRNATTNEDRNKYKEQIKNFESEISSARMSNVKNFFNPLTTAVGSNIRASYKQAESGEKLSLSNVSHAIRESNEARGPGGRTILGEAVDKFKYVSNIQGDDVLDLSNLSKEDRKKKENDAKKDYEEYHDNLLKDLNYTHISSQIQNAFALKTDSSIKDFASRLVYKDYEDYKRSNPSGISEDVYNEWYNKFKQDFNKKQKYENIVKANSTLR